VTGRPTYKLGSPVHARYMERLDDFRQRLPEDRTFVEEMTGLLDLWHAVADRDKAADALSVIRSQIGLDPART
jgi:hypothetical protein